MEKIKPYQLLGTRVRKIQSGSELVYMNELNKYTKKHLGLELDLSDVHVDKRLLDGDLFSYVTHNGLVFSKPVDPDTLVEYGNSLRFFFTPEIEELGFIKYDLEGGEVIYSFNHDIEKNIILHKDSRSQGYVSLYAMLVVLAYKAGVQPPKLIISHEKYNQQESEYLDLDILMNYGNKFLEGGVDIISPVNEFGNQREWQAFLIYHRQLGLMNGTYTINEKYNHLTRNFEVGDVVLMYRTSKELSGRVINELKSCHPAVIRSINQQGVTLEYYPIVQTKLTREVSLLAVDKEFHMGNRKSIYSEEDYTRFTRCRENFSLTELGVNHCTYKESVFILEPMADDGTKQYFQNAEGAYEEVQLDTFDTIYAVFKDQGVEFNAERYVDKYFTSRGVTPVYDFYQEQARIYKENKDNNPTV